MTVIDIFADLVAAGTWSPSARGLAREPRRRSCR